MAQQVLIDAVTIASLLERDDLAAIIAADCR